jgi:hypothetical protein
VGKMLMEPTPVLQFTPQLPLQRQCTAPSHYTNSTARDICSLFTSM